MLAIDSIFMVVLAKVVSRVYVCLEYKKVLVVCVLAQKGGVGKTMLAIQLLIAAWLANKACCIIDLDPQRSAEHWADLRARLLGIRAPAIVSCEADKLRDVLAAASRTMTEIVIMDTPPVVNRATILAAGEAHVILVPTRASVLDEFSLRETLDVLKASKAIRRALVVINAVEDDSDDEGEQAIYEIAAEYGVSVVKTLIENDPEYRSALREGKGIVEAAPKSHAARQIKALLRLLSRRAPRARNTGGEE